MSKHSTLTESNGIHQPFHWIWSDAASRAAESLASEDVNKIGYQQDTQVVYMLKDLSPTWESIAGGGFNDFTAEDAVTDEFSTAITVGHNSSGTPAAGFGTDVLFQAETTTTEDEDAGTLGIGWLDPTHASRKAQFRLGLNFSGYNRSELFITARERLGNFDGVARGAGAFEFQDRSADTFGTNQEESVILGGVDNYIGNAGGADKSVIIGSIQSVIDGGQTSLVASSSASQILGGSFNGIMLSDYSTIENLVSRSVIIGSYYSSIKSGATASVILGGYANEVSGDALNSVVLGTDGWSDGINQLVTGAGKFASVGDAQTFTTNVSAQETHSDATWRRLLAGGSAQLSLRSDAAWAFEVLIVGATAGQAKTFAYKITGAIENDGGTTALKGTPAVTVIDDSDDVSFDARAVADDANDALGIEVSDSDGGGDTVRWVAHVRIAEILYA